MAPSAEQPPDPWRARLATIHTPHEFADCLRRLKDSSGLTNRQIVRGSAGQIGVSTVTHLVTGRGAPTHRSIAGFLLGCRVAEHHREPWFAKREELFGGPRPAPAARQPGPWLMRAAGGAGARAHFEKHAHGFRGSPILDHDLFHGRAAALDSLRSWLSAPDPPGRPMVVTGQPGAGKSAVLSRLVVALARNADRPGVAIHALGASVLDVKAAVAAAVGLDPGIPEKHLLERLSEERRPAPLPVVVDALDEAITAPEAARLARFLTDLATVPTVRVVVATRPRTAGDRFAIGSLLNLLGVDRRGAAELVDLDEDRYFDVAELVFLVATILRQDGARNPAPADGAWRAYRDDLALTGRLARVIVRRAGRNYLVAALAATHLSRRAAIVDPAADGFDQAALPSTVGEAIEKYVATLPEDSPTLGLLTALAYARGDGVTDRRWIAFARALGYPVAQPSLDALRGSPAVDYLLETIDTGDGRVTRLFHAAYVDELIRGRGGRLADETALVDLMRPAPAESWRAADAYVRRHFCEHAVQVMRIRELLRDRSYLSVADLDRLLPLLPPRPEGADEPIMKVLTTAHHRARHLAPEPRLRLFSLTAALLGFDPHLFADPAECRVVWAHNAVRPHQRIPAQSRTMALGRLGGAYEIVSTGPGGAVSVWSARGSSRVTFQAGEGGTVTAIAVGSLGDDEVIVTAGYDRAIRIRDENGKEIVGCIEGHAGTVTGVALGSLAGVDVIVSADTDGTVLVWDREGRGLRRLTGHRGWVNAVAVGRFGSRHVVVSAGADRTIRVWDSAGRELLRLTGHTDNVTTVAVGRLNGRDVIVSGCWDGTVLVWGIDGEIVAGPLAGHTDAVTAVAIGRLLNQDVIASASVDTKIQVWDGDGRPLGEPLSGHRDRVNAVAGGRLGDQEVIVSASSDRTIRVWDAERRPVGSLAGHTDTVTAVAALRRDGRVALLSAGDDCSLRRWDMDGRPLREPVAVPSVDGAPVAVGSLGGAETMVWAVDGVIRRWDGRNRPGGLRADRVTALAVGRLGDREVIVAGAAGGVLGWDADGRVVLRVKTAVRRPAAVGIGHRAGQNLLAVAAHGGLLLLFDHEGRLAGRVQSGIDRPTAIALGRFGGGDVLVVAGQDETVEVWDAGQRLVESLDVLGVVRDIALLPDGRMCLATGNALVLLSEINPL